MRVLPWARRCKVMKGRIDPDLDYKEGDLGKLLEVVRELDMVEACTLYGSWERCEQMAAEEPRLRIRPSADFPLQVPTVARTLRPAMVNFDWHAVSEEGIRLAHSHGCLAFVNCLGRADTETYMQWAVEAGCRLHPVRSAGSSGCLSQAKGALSPSFRRIGTAEDALAVHLPAISLSMTDDGANP